MTLGATCTSLLIYLLAQAQEAVPCSRGQPAPLQADPRAATLGHHSRSSPAAPGLCRHQTWVPVALPGPGSDPVSVLPGAEQESLGFGAGGPCVS